MVASRPDSLLGSVIIDWEVCGKPSWDVAETVRRTIAADERLAARDLNPARKFRAMRLEGNQEYLEAWVRFGLFPWLR